jgi:hypothetical protein
MTMTYGEAERALTSYAETTGGRDALVRAALAAGVSKHRIHQLSGIARTTIDRIVSEAGDGCPDCGRAECTGEDCYWPDEAGLRQ